MGQPTDVIYLDHAATAPPDPAVVDAMRPYLEGRFGNPSEPHALGRQAREDLDAAREEIGVLLGAEDVVLTGGGTEAAGLAAAKILRLLIGTGSSIGSSHHRQRGHLGIPRPFQVSTRPATQRTDAKSP